MKWNTDRFSYAMVSGLLLSTSAWLAGGIAAQAQVTPDGTMGTSISQTGSNFTINGGTRPSNGPNLFHSFSQFSVPTGGAAIFNNAPDVVNIFGRVTGGSVSNINGLIQTTGGANVYLMNPAGIMFGPNARLNVAGSFIATSANSIQFAGGGEFRADTTPSSLLTINVPIGLQLGPNAGPIKVQGPAAPSPFVRPSTLSLTPGQTLALVGGQIDIDSANLQAPDGRIELWAVRNAEVTINNQTGWHLTSPAVTANWGTITLENISSIDASGLNGGAINIHGRGLSVQDGSNISSNTLAGQGKGITVQTTDFVDLLGASLPGQFGPGIGTSVGSLFGSPGSGRAGDVTVETGRLRLANGAWLQSSSSSNNSRSGDVTVRASDVEVIGVNPFFSVVPTSITTTLFSGTKNESGKITIEANRIRVLDGGIISTALVNMNPALPVTGKSGDIAIRATESLEISGFTPIKLLSGVSTAIGQAEGKAGDITIDVGRLQLSNGGTIRTTLSGIGQAGNISIKAADVTISDPVVDVLSHLPGGITVAVSDNSVGSGGTIDLTANSLRLFNGGQITSSSQGQGTAGNVNLNVGTIDVQGKSQFLVSGQYLPSTISAASATAFAAGSVNIVSRTLQVQDSAQITVSNSGSGDAGNLDITARKVFLNHNASLQASVNGGNQGNIRLQVSQLLLLRHGSSIVTNAFGTSTGGNITINAPIIAGFENSDIVANAVQGRGGNIQITTQGIFGLKFRDQLTPENDITASSQFGVSGTVIINDFGIDPNTGLVQLSTDLVDSSQKIATGCGGNQGSSFVATGRGGVPENPTQYLSDDRTWEDVRDLSAYRTPGTSGYPISVQTPASSTIIEATAWQRHSDGSVELIASPTSTPLPNFVNCSGSVATMPSPVISK